MNDSDLVRVFQGATPSEAEVVRALLEAAELPAFVPDRNTPFPGVPTFSPLGGSGTVLGCEVYVREQDLERARAEIADARQRGADDGGPDDDGSDDGSADGDGGSD